MNSNQVPARILVSSGEPAGIGPDLIIGLSQQKTDLRNLTVLCDPDLLHQRAKQLGVAVELCASSATDDASQHAIKVLPVKLKHTVKPGQLDIQNAQYLIEMLSLGIDECLAENYDALVTGPLQKSVINDAGISFTGHTEFLAERCGGMLPVMLLCCPQLRVALVTTHLPLRQVADAITAERLSETLRIIHQDMQYRYNIAQPRLTVCGLNPHAGEGGHLGLEEQIIMIPVIDDLRQAGLHITGPLPADTAFRDEIREQTDVFVCMYHDQGLPVLKTLGFGEAVNVTLGLPIIRTSVDHGTALSLAGTGKANCESLLAAIDMAKTLCRNQSQFQQQLTSKVNG